MDPKTRGILAYITWIGWIIAIATNNPKDEFASFHIRQGLGIALTGIALWILMFIPFLGWVLAPLAGIALFVFWIMGLVSAAQGEMKPIPLLGKLYQDWFKGL